MSPPQGSSYDVVPTATSSWKARSAGPAQSRLLTDIAYADYEKFTILDVEAQGHITRARASTRGWR